MGRAMNLLFRMRILSNQAELPGCIFALDCFQTDARMLPVKSILSAEHCRRGLCISKRMGLIEKQLKSSISIRNAWQLIHVLREDLAHAIFRRQV